jgi:hypothetical protein
LAVASALWFLYYPAPMTAEIAVANRIGLALAADSASTSFSQERVAKIYNSADKLFALHEREPIGAMIYGSSSFGGIPWEILIKLFRSAHPNPCDTINDYGEAFLDFLRTTPVINDEAVDGSFSLMVRSLLQQVHDAVTTEVAQKAVSLDQVAKDFIDKSLQNWSSKAFLGTMDDSTLQQLKARYDAFLEPLAADLLKQYNLLDPTYRERLKEFILLYAVKDIVQDATGIVIAGFGREQIFPALISYDIESMIYPRQLRYREKKREEISLTNVASIVPFAQEEMVHSFMTGVDPPLRDRVSQTLGKVMEKLVEELKSKLPNSLSQNEVDSFQLDGLKATSVLLKEFDDTVGNYSMQRYIKPVLDAVGALPKDQLAVMAETLVALTSFKKKMSMDSETVGGAIDVAVISKGDGFVWIKRKHYFDLALNPRYTERIRTFYNQPVP